MPAAPARVQADATYSLLVDGSVAIPVCCTRSTRTRTRSTALRATPRSPRYRRPRPGDRCRARGRRCPGRLADDLPELMELDLNPVMVRPDGVITADVRVRLEPNRPRHPYQRALR